METGTARHWVGRRRLIARDGDAWVVPRATAAHPPGERGDHAARRRASGSSVDAPDPALLRGSSATSRRCAAFTAEGRVDRFWRNRNPLQDALTV